MAISQLNQLQKMWNMTKKFVLLQKVVKQQTHKAKKFHLGFMHADKQEPGTVKKQTGTVK